MTRAELHASLLDRVLGLDPEGYDRATADRLKRSLRRLEPDPLFRRRLRGAIVNYHVAAREGHLAQSGRPRRQMGTLGRSVLYASVVLALGVSAVGAASHDSLPGDPLYGVKLRLEEIRMRIAPESVRDDLAELALDERAQELQRLVDAAAWTLVPAAAERLTSAEMTLVAIEPSAVSVPATAHAIDVLQSVLSQAPEAARPGLQHALEAAGSNAGGASATQPAHPSPTAGPRGNGKGRIGHDQGGDSGPN